MNALFEVEKHVKVVVEDAILDGPFTLYTIQLNERLINGFEITSLGTDKDGESGFNFIIFKKSREEKMIYHKFARRDCYFAILKPSLRKYIVDNSEVQNYYTKALNYYEKRNFKAAELNIKEIETLIRTAFKPGVVLLKKIEFKRRTHKPKDNIQAKLRDLNMHDTDAGLRGGPKDGSATPSEARTRREPVDMNRLSAKNIRVSAN